MDFACLTQVVQARSSMIMLYRPTWHQDKSKLNLKLSPKVIIHQAIILMHKKLCSQISVIPEKSHTYIYVPSPVRPLGTIS